VSDASTSPASDPDPRKSTPGHRRLFQGWGTAVARGLALAANALVRISRLGFDEAKERGGHALHQFAQRPQQTRQRVYAFSSYGLILALTLAAQLWEPNSLQAYVKIEPVALPEATVIFVRNDSGHTWKDVKVLLNDRFEYQRPDLPPTHYISLQIDRFASYDANGKASYAAKDLVPKKVSIECDRGHFLLDLEKQP
jgi:hypothetical protein